MLSEIGHFALALALGLSIVQVVLPTWGLSRNDAALTAVAAPAALGVFLLMTIAFGALTVGYIVSDFSIANVVQNSHSAKPLIYKISGVWGNHEGSILLWTFILALFGALVALARKSLPPRLRAGTLAAQALITIAFLLFLILTSNPFRRLDPAPMEGAGLNPILQDPGLAIHPPLLYIGYVGFSITYAFAIAALVDGRIDAVWARAVRPWTLIAWVFLTLGIAMGSYWAYYELGWGGWWFWDPVENASLMPWLAGTALIHSTVVMEKRDALKVWTILLAILAFSLSLLGTFLVRSGVLTSVHAFASDPARGVFILAILVLFIGGSLALFAWRAPLLKQGGLFAPVSREGALVLNNLFFAVACGAVFLGTLYPLALEALTGAKISVGAPFFNATFIPILVPILLALPLAQTLAWKRGDLLGAMQRVAAAFAIGALVAVAIFAMAYGGPVAAPLGIGLGVFIIMSAIWDVGERALRSKTGLGGVIARARGLPRSVWGTALAHAGTGVSILGVAAAAWSSEALGTLRVGQSLETSGYRITLENVVSRVGPNYKEEAGFFSITYKGAPAGEVESGKRIYLGRSGMPTTEAGIATYGVSQLYVSLAEPQPDGSVGVRVYYKPLVLLIWLGTVVMSFGGLLAITDRRYRVAAPTRRRKPDSTGNAPLAQPAE